MPEAPPAPISGKASLWQRTRRSWRRLGLSFAGGGLLAWLWHLGWTDPPWQPGEPAFWVHLASEVLVALGAGGSLFVLSGAALRYWYAHAPRTLEPPKRSR
jgi:hypothetical protein